MRLREIAKRVKLLEESGGAGGAGGGAPDTGKLHSVDPASSEAVAGYDSVSGFFEDATFIDVRADLAFFPPLEDDEGYFLEFQWGGNSVDDGVLIMTSTTPSVDSNGFINVRQHRGPTPAVGGLQDSVYMAPGFTVLLEAQGAGRFSPPNVYGLV